jgi:uncharacterized repeat protein (TIGR03803 family)
MGIVVFMEVNPVPKRTIRVLANAAFALIVSVFLTMQVSAASTEKVLAAFKPIQGTIPMSELVFDKGGNLYGTTTSDGRYGAGTVFEMQKTSHGGWKIVVLFSFPSGATPGGGVIFDNVGNLYGTTFYGGGKCNCGTVYELSPSQQGWKHTVLYKFVGQKDGAFPSANLVFDNAGNLYGTTFEGGGRTNGGTVFKLAPLSGGGWMETVLHRFTGMRVDGRNPWGTLIFDVKGNLYGATARGGRFTSGTIFELSPGTQSWIESVLHSFPGGKWGSNPHAGLVFDDAGNLYGTTYAGGSGFGVVFELSPSSMGWIATAIHRFSNREDGGSPADRLAFANGNLYGTTTTGGTIGLGVVFELTPALDGYWHEKMLHSFLAGRDGEGPSAGVTLDTTGNLYGTAAGGGISSGGVVFELMP